MFRDIKKTDSFKNKCMYVFGPPGWSHDGSKKTAKQLREEFYHSRNFTNSELRL
jgi:hypothetical protein